MRRSRPVVRRMRATGACGAASDTPPPSPVASRHASISTDRPLESMNDSCWRSRTSRGPSFLIASRTSSRRTGAVNRSSSPATATTTASPRECRASRSFMGPSSMSHCTSTCPASGPSQTTISGMNGDEAALGVRLPSVRLSPLRAVLRRMGLALALMLAMFLLVAADLDGYRDTADGDVSLLDALYYVTVSISTTGYGDVAPVSTAARIVNVVAVTPLRIAFLVLLVGTTLEVLTRRTRDEFLVDRWRSRLKDHVVIVGYGTKGRAAARTLLEDGCAKERIVVVDPDPAVVEEAASGGFAGVL